MDLLAEASDLARRCGLAWENTEMSPEQLAKVLTRERDAVKWPGRRSRRGESNPYLPMPLPARPGKPKKSRLPPEEDFFGPDPDEAGDLDEALEAMFGQGGPGGLPGLPPGGTPELMSLLLKVLVANGGQEASKRDIERIFNSDPKLGEELQQVLKKFRPGRLPGLPAPGRRRGQVW
jgi:hypothetical protein